MSTIDERNDRVSNAACEAYDILCDSLLSEDEATTCEDFCDMNISVMMVMANHLGSMDPDSRHRLAFDIMSQALDMAYSFDEDTVCPACQAEMEAEAAEAAGEVPAIGTIGTVPKTEG